MTVCHSDLWIIGSSQLTQHATEQAFSHTNKQVLLYCRFWRTDNYYYWFFWFKIWLYWVWQQSANRSLMLKTFRSLDWNHQLHIGIWSSSKIWYIFIIFINNTGILDKYKRFQFRFHSFPTQETNEKPVIPTESTECWLRKKSQYKGYK